MQLLACSQRHWSIETFVAATAFMFLTTLPTAFAAVSTAFARSFNHPPFLEAEISARVRFRVCNGSFMTLPVSSLAQFGEEPLAPILHVPCVSLYLCQL